MPNKTVLDIVSRLAVLEQKVQKHLDDGIIVISNIEGLKTNVKWLTWLTTAIAGGIIVQALVTLFKK